MWKKPLRRKCLRAFCFLPVCLFTSLLSTIAHPDPFDDQQGATPGLGPSIDHTNKLTCWLGAAKLPSSCADPQKLGTAILQDNILSSNEAKCQLLSIIRMFDEPFLIARYCCEKQASLFHFYLKIIWKTTVASHTARERVLCHPLLFAIRLLLVAFHRDPGRPVRFPSVLHAEDDVARLRQDASTRGQVAIARLLLPSCAARNKGLRVIVTSRENAWRTRKMRVDFVFGS